MADNAFDVLQQRGFVQQVTDEEAVRKLFSDGPVVVYIGYDPTAASLHAGSLLTLMPLLHLERLGHRPIAVVGGGTAMVGDPSGKTEMRRMLTAEDISANAARIEKQIGQLLDFEGKSRFVNNAEWLLELGYIEFLRDIGRHFSVNRMLQAEAYKMRMERGLSFIEFNYQLLQAYDFLQLRRRHDCRLQMGGDDQWGNILAGVDLCRRVDGELVQGLTFPLLTTATGEKMGKTADGAIWLDADLLSPYDYYQYWVNTHDDDVEKMLGYFTFLPMDEVRKVAQLPGASLNAAKSVLAYETTKLLHGRDAALEAHRGAMAGFGGRELPAEILPSSDVPRQAVADVAQLPTTELSAAAVAAGPKLIDLMASCGLAASKGAARRLVEQGAVKIGDRRVDEQLYVVTSEDFDDESALTVRVGKKKLHRFVLLS